MLRLLNPAIFCVLLFSGLTGCGLESTPSAKSKGEGPAIKTPKVFSTLVPGEGSAKIVTALHLAGKTLWIGTKSGLHAATFYARSRQLELSKDAETAARFDKTEITDLQGEGDRVLAGSSGGFASRDSASGWSSEETGRINAVASFQGLIYAGRSSAIERLGSSKSWEKLVPQPPLTRNQTSAQFINSLAIGKEGDVWAGTKFGVLHFTPATSKWEHFYGPYQDIKSEKVVTDELGNSELAGNYVNQVRVDPNSGKLLVSTDIGVSIYDGKWVSYIGEHTKYIAKDDALVRIPVKGNLALPPSSEVHAAALEDATLWIGTKNGLARLSGSQLEIFDSERGLPDDSVRALAIDLPSHTIFVGTDAGVAVMGYEAPQE